MALTPAQAGSDFSEIVRLHGIPITILYWPQSSIFYQTDYDQERTPATSGTTISGGAIIQPIGTGDAQYLEQGKLQKDDMKMYVAGSLTMPSNSIITIGNTGSKYDIVPDTIRRWDLSGTTIYQQAFIRTRPEGS